MVMNDDDVLTGFLLGLEFLIVNANINTKIINNKDVRNRENIQLL